MFSKQKYKKYKYIFGVKKNKVKYKDKMFKINLQLLVIKSHFFMLFAATAGLVPFLPLVARQAGLSATATGIIYAILPFVVTIMKPVFGIIVDKSHRLILILELLTVVFLTSTLITKFIPAIRHDSRFNVTVECESTLQIFVPESCDYDGRFTCELHCNACNASLACQNHHFSLNLHKYNATSSTSILESSDNHTELCAYFQINDCELNCENVTCHSKSEYSTYQFWVMLVLLVICGSTFDILICLSDAACYEMLQSKSELYGRQRIYGTIGWGLFTVFIGHLIDVFSEGNTKLDYSPAYYAFIIGMIVDALILYKLQVDMKNISQNILKDIGKILSDVHIDVFISAVFFVGLLTAFQWNYTFWYLEDLGASKMLSGLTMTAECFLAEAPVMFFAGWIINKIGHEISMLLAFPAFFIRFIVMSYIVNPWYMFTVSVLHGISYGLFYVAMTSFAKHSAAPGTEASLQCLLSGSFSGLGIAVGSLSAGVAFDKFGGRLAFRYAGILAIICFVLYLTLFFLLKIRAKYTKGAAQKCEMDLLNGSKVQK